MSLLHGPQRKQQKENYIITTLRHRASSVTLHAEEGTAIKVPGKDIISDVWWMIVYLNKILAMPSVITNCIQLLYGNAESSKEKAAGLQKNISWSLKNHTSSSSEGALKFKAMAIADRSQ